MAASITTPIKAAVKYSFDSFRLLSDLPAKVEKKHGAADPHQET